MRNFLLNRIGCIIAILGMICISCQNSPDQKEKKIINQDTDNLNVKKIDSVMEFQDSINVQITVKPNALYTEGSKLDGIYSLSNNSDTPINFGSDFIIEKKVDEHWIKEPFVESLGFEDIVLNLNPGSSKEYPLWLSKILKKVKPGEYRIKKEVWPVGKKEKKVTVTAKFTIQ